MRTIDEMDAVLSGEVHLWIADASSLHDAKARACCRELVSDEEREREKHYQRDSDQRMFLLARMLTRRVLSHYYPLHPRDWRFETNEHGRPQLAPDHDLHSLAFNVSHSDGLVICAIAAGAIGVDTEGLSRSSEAIDVAESYFTASEYQHLQAAPEVERLALFLSYWTLKEAFIKARGEGLSIPLNRFHFDLTHAGLCQLYCDLSLNEDPRRWRFWLLRVEQQHLAAICAQRVGARVPHRVRVREVIPLGGEREMNVEILRSSPVNPSVREVA